MKRNSEEMDMGDNSLTSLEGSSAPKRAKENQEENSLLHLTMDIDSRDEPVASEQSLLNVFKKFVGAGRHSMVERDPNPTGHPLVNSNYVGKQSHYEMMDLEADTSNASQFIVANMGNKVDQIGRQMKNLHENLRQVMQDSLRDSQLHMAACNFVKKPGQVYHLYERPSGQKYFSMLSPQDWDGNSPHKFLGSWYLEADQSWTPAEERHARFEGVTFIKKLLLDSKNKSIQ
ncbi:uncharacterized protein C1orf50 homolog [Anthonomus grandis grandis]|uniref:uncharacterized protein C1orf50 homolog n=1 Tax=Anthonomus grandis grandis TaxID=2921223 RepID=UPI002164F86D|nr:uncharacterized protein C1orf50 homolog [Anthonomus grandis grandis]